MSQRKHRAGVESVRTSGKRAKDSRLAKLKPNIKKIVESVLFLIEEGIRSGFTITQYDIVKSIFVADVYHLQKFGRPVTFDNYAAMKDGPVPSETYNMLKPDYDGATRVGAEWPLWETEAAPEIGVRARKFVRPKRHANKRRLSQTDIDELRQALLLVKKLGFSGVRDWTHSHPAYVHAWENRGTKGSRDIDYHMLLEHEDKDLVADLIHASKHI